MGKLISASLLLTFGHEREMVIYPLYPRLLTLPQQTLSYISMQFYSQDSFWLWQLGAIKLPSSEESGTHTVEVSELIIPIIIFSLSDSDLLESVNFHHVTTALKGIGDLVDSYQQWHIYQG